MIWGLTSLKSLIIPLNGVTGLRRQKRTQRWYRGAQEEDVSHMGLTLSKRLLNVIIEGRTKMILPFSKEKYEEHTGTL